MMLYPGLLLVHIVAASIGLASGATALFAAKGGVPHRRAGRIFLVSMVVMAGLGLVIALMRDARISFVPSILTCYLVVTGALTVLRRPGTTGPLDFVALATALFAAGLGFALGWEPIQGPTGKDAHGYPAAAYLIFGSISLFAAMLDIKVLLARGVHGGHRVARHLWRMGLALLIATTSFFSGQAKLFPDAVRESGILNIPALVVVAALLFWLAKVGFDGVRRRSAA